VTVQERLQNICPALLSTTIFKGTPYVLKEMQPTMDKIDFLVVRDRYKDIACVVEDMAFLTASAQLRSAGRQGAATPDDLIAFGQDPQWQRVVLDYAAAYAAQVKADYQTYFAAYKAGFFA
jgi:rhamnose utilization protein RhaD (predicted bifunctional aldolase and dehydrogenase)